MGYVEIPEWRPVRGVIEIDLYIMQAPASREYVFDGRDALTDNDRFGILTVETDLTQFISNDARITQTIFINGVSESPYILGINNIRIETINPAGIVRFGSRWNNVGFFDGQIHSIRLTDLDNPENSRFYPSVIRSESIPDDLVLVDELGQREEPVLTLSAGSGLIDINGNRVETYIALQTQDRF